MSRASTGPLGRRLLALVPSRLTASSGLPAPVRRAVSRVGARVRNALDLPSRAELGVVVARLEQIAETIEDLKDVTIARPRAHPEPSSPSPAPEPGPAPDPTDDVETRLAREEQKVKQLRKELKRELQAVSGDGKAGKASKASKKAKKTKKGKKLRKPHINVGSPKSLKERSKRSRSRDNERDTSPSKTRKGKGKGKRKGKPD